MPVTTTTFCGADVHILKGESPVAPGLTIGHGSVSAIERLGSGVRGCREGQRVIAGALTPSGWSNACLYGVHSQDGSDTADGWKRWAVGGSETRSTAARPSSFSFPDAMSNLAPVPDSLTASAW